METILAYLAAFVISVIEATGYTGIFILMAVESANIPVPSEIIMPFSGFLVVRDNLMFFWVVVAGALGNLAGSLLSYYAALWGGRPFLERYGRFFFLSGTEIGSAERLFEKYGTATVFFSRLLPIVRTFISFPAGLARMNVWKFSLYTLAGSFLWSLLLTYLGFVAGENWDMLETYFRKFDWAIAIVLAVGLAWFVIHRVKQRRHE
ncbi:MAG: DedA family protein [bacterium]|nr:DedA family protein [bacterium]MDZ4231933.1 DedA family protein [Candidatus Pacearchaeota archaeon]